MKLNTCLNYQDLRYIKKKTETININFFFIHSNKKTQGIQTHIVLTMINFRFQVHVFNFPLFKKILLEKLFILMIRLSNFLF